MRTALVCLALLVCPMAAHACEVPAPFAIEDIRNADAVFAGRLVDYRLIVPAVSAPSEAFAVLTFDVDTVIKGQVSDTVQISWRNSTYAVADEWETRVPLLIAAFRHNSDPSEPELRLLQTMCGPAFALDDTPENRSSVRKALNGKPVQPREYFALQQAEARRKPIAPDSPPALKGSDGLSPGWTSAILAGLALAGWLLIRRKD